MMKSRGPRTAPWGIPLEEVYKKDRLGLSSHLTRKEQDDKCDLNEFRTEPRIPSQNETRVIKML